MYPQDQEFEKNSNFGAALAVSEVWFQYITIKVPVKLNVLLSISNTLCHGGCDDLHTTGIGMNCIVRSGPENNVILTDLAKQLLHIDVLNPRINYNLHIVARLKVLIKIREK